MTQSTEKTAEGQPSIEERLEQYSAPESFADAIAPEQAEELIRFSKHYAGDPISVDQRLENLKNHKGPKDFIIGAGNAGLESARKALEAGHFVFIVDADDMPGGLGSASGVHQMGGLSFVEKGKRRREIDMKAMQILEHANVLFLPKTWIDPKNAEYINALGLDGTVVAAGGKEKRDAKFDYNHPSIFTSKQFIEAAQVTLLTTGEAASPDNLNGKRVARNPESGFLAPVLFIGAGNVGLQDAPKHFQGMVLRDFAVQMHGDKARRVDIESAVHGGILNRARELEMNPNMLQDRAIIISRSEKGLTRPMEPSSKAVKEKMADGLIKLKEMEGKKDKDQQDPRIATLTIEDLAFETNEDLLGATEDIASDMARYEKTFQEAVRTNVDTIITKQGIKMIDQAVVKSYKELEDGSGRLEVTLLVGPKDAQKEVVMTVGAIVTAIGFEGESMPVGLEAPAESDGMYANGRGNINKSSADAEGAMRRLMRAQAADPKAGTRTVNVQAIEALVAEVKKSGFDGNVISHILNRAPSYATKKYLLRLGEYEGRNGKPGLIREASPIVIAKFTDDSPTRFDFGRSAGPASEFGVQSEVPIKTNVEIVESQSVLPPATERFHAVLTKHQDTVKTLDALRHAVEDSRAIQVKTTILENLRDPFMAQSGSVKSEDVDMVTMLLNMTEEQVILHKYFTGDNSKDLHNIEERATAHYISLHLVDTDKKIDRKQELDMRMLANGVLEHRVGPEWKSIDDLNTLRSILGNRLGITVPGVVENADVAMRNMHRTIAAEQGMFGRFYMRLQLESMGLHDAVSLTEFSSIFSEFSVSTEGFLYHRDLKGTGNLKRVNSDRQMRKLLNNLHEEKLSGRTKSEWTEIQKERQVTKALNTAAIIAGIGVSAGVNYLTKSPGWLAIVGAMIAPTFRSMSASKAQEQDKYAYGSEEYKNALTFSRASGMGAGFLWGLIGENALEVIAGVNPLDAVFHNTPSIAGAGAGTESFRASVESNIAPEIIAPTTSEVVTPEIPTSETLYLYTGVTEIDIHKLVSNPRWPEMLKQLEVLPEWKRNLVVDWSSHFMNHGGWIEPKSWMVEGLQQIIDAPDQKAYLETVRPALNILAESHIH